MALFTIKTLLSLGYKDRPLKLVLAGDEEVGHQFSTAAEDFAKAVTGAKAAFNFETGYTDNGIVIGRKGVEIEKLRNDLRAKFGREFSLEVNEIRRPEVDSQLVAENIAQQLERRVAFRRAMKRTVTMARKFGAEGIKVTCSGRLAGAEIARTEWYRDGRVPLQTLRADIDYGFAEARTTYGIIGVKAWIYKGEILDKEVER